MVQQMCIRMSKTKTMKRRSTQKQVNANVYANIRIHNYTHETYKQQTILLVIYISAMLIFAQRTSGLPDEFVCTSTLLLCCYINVYVSDKIIIHSYMKFQMSKL